MESFLERGRKTILQEAEALAAFAALLDGSFDRACEAILACSGTVVLTGMGKSGLVARKWAATFMSTGTRAYFLNPAEASHGDLGLIHANDVLVALSASGETEELRPVLRFVKENDVPSIAVTQNRVSTLARSADIVLPLEVRAEACPLGLAPTTSTTLMMALGDAVAVALMERRGFSEKDFARLHPGGSLGRRLWLNVAELMHAGDQIPRVGPRASLQEVLLEMTRKSLGITMVEDAECIHGIITDGDLRRAFQQRGMDETLRAEEIATRHPKRIRDTTLATEAAEQMARLSIQHFLVENHSGVVVGVVHLHDLLRARVT